MVEVKDWARYYARPAVYGIEFIHAHFVKHAFARHVHDYYAIGVIERGVQTFTAKGSKRTTPTDGVFLLNPDVPHTGEPATENGFTYRTFYPTTALLQKVAGEMAGKPQPLPFFAPLVVTDEALTRRVLALHRTLLGSNSTLEGETGLLETLVFLIKYYADSKYPVQAIGQERAAVRLVRDYLEINYNQDIALTELAHLVAFSPFYLTRVFQAEIGLPPHAYHESVRIRHAQQMLLNGKSLALVSQETGFVDQSHFTNRFKRLIGVTPGQYLQQRNIIQDHQP